MKRFLGVLLAILGIATIFIFIQWDSLQSIVQPKGEKISPLRSKEILASDIFLDEILEKQNEIKEQKQEQVNRFIDNLIKEMTLKEKLAQLMILTNEKDITENVIRTYQPGGIIFFSPDFKGKSTKEVTQRVERIQSYSELPLFVGVDEEGGEVSRIAGLTDEELPIFSSARKLYEEGGTALVLEDAKQKAEWLQKMGINLNFDPVADVVSNPNAYMYNRSASGKPEEVSEYVKTVIGVMKESRIGSCVKHFPGYSNNANTHLTYATDSKKLSVYETADFQPFVEGINAGTDMVMVSHIVMKSVDKNNPASLSKEVHGLLRENLGFEGVIIADDLNMKAILNQMDLGQAAALAIAAGNDMIFSADFNKTFTGIKTAVDNNELQISNIDASVERILKMKLNLGLITIEE